MGTSSVAHPVHTVPSGSPFVGAMMPNTSPIRRLAVAAGLLIAVLVACGKEITGPASTPVNVFKRLAPFAFAAQYETAIPARALPAAL